MQTLSDIQIVITVTLFLLVITSFVVAFIIIYQSRYNKHQKEKAMFKEELLKTKLEIQEDTMQSISHEIHDNIGQVLSLCKLHLATMALDIHNPAREKIDTTKDLLSQAIIDLRNLSKTLNKEYIAHESVATLLQMQLMHIKKADVHNTHFNVQGAEESIDPGKQLILFRMVQESLQNIIKHADAKNIAIQLTYQHEQLQLSIRDDGKGFDKEAYTKGNGIYNMMYKAKLIGATYEIKSKIGTGTQVEIILPTH